MENRKTTLKNAFYADIVLYSALSAAVTVSSFSLVVKIPLIVLFVSILSVEFVLLRSVLKSS